MIKKRLSIQGMHCVNCAMLIDGALEDLPGVQSANTNYARQMVDIEYDENTVSENELVAAIKESGYSANLPASN
jgi:copper chaperone CopZ